MALIILSIDLVVILFTLPSLRIYVFTLQEMVVL